MISSPDRNADGMYDNNVDILWMIEAATMNLIRYQLLYIEMEISEGCKNDAVRVRIYYF